MNLLEEQLNLFVKLMEVGNKPNYMPLFSELVLKNKEILKQISSDNLIEIMHYLANHNLNGIEMAILFKKIKGIIHNSENSP
jgi:hypothetical protein